MRGSQLQVEALQKSRLPACGRPSSPLPCSNYIGSSTACCPLPLPSANQSCQHHPVTRAHAFSRGLGTSHMVHYAVSRRTQRDLKLRLHSHHGFGQVCNSSTRAKCAHGGGTPALGRRTGRGYRSCRMVVGCGHLSSRRYHSLHKRETVTVSQAWTMVHHYHNEAEICVRGSPLGYRYAGSVMAGLEQAPQAVWLAHNYSATIAPCLFSPGSPCSAGCHSWS
jgi:hypothetical protein